MPWGAERRAASGRGFSRTTAEGKQGDRKDDGIRKPKARRERWVFGILVWNFAGRSVGKRLAVGRQAPCRVRPGFSRTTAEGRRGIARTMASGSPKRGEKYGCLVLVFHVGSGFSRTTAEGRRGIARTMASGSPKRGEKYGCLVLSVRSRPPSGCLLPACGHSHGDQSTRHSSNPPDHSGWRRTSRRSDLVVTGVNVARLNLSISVP